MQNDIQNNEFGRKVFDQLISLFISPAIKRRQDAGELPKPLDLRAAQIIFFPDGRQPEVRINSEIRGIGKVKLKPSITKKFGEPIYENEVEGLDTVNLTSQDDPNCGHATLIRFSSRWTIVFDFRYNKALSKKHIDAAKEFYEAAEFSFDKKNWVPFIDNLFSTAELLAMSVLLSFADPKFRKKATHKAIQMRYNRFADLGNVDASYRYALNKLSGLRNNVRYLKSSFSVSESDALRFLNIVKNMIEDALLWIKEI